jgi:hypothetical protein
VCTRGRLAVVVGRFSLVERFAFNLATAEMEKSAEVEKSANHTAGKKSCPENGLRRV